LNGDEDAGETSPGGADVLMLAVPNLGFSNNNNRGSDMQEAALLLSKLMTLLRQSNITPLSFVSLQLEKVVYLPSYILLTSALFLRGCFCKFTATLHMWPKLWTHLTKTSLFKVKHVIAV